MASSTTANYLHNKQMKHLLQGVVFTPPTELWIGLFTTVPQLDGSGGVEVSTSGTAYGRVKLASTTAGWTGASGTNQEYSNAADLVFQVPTANWGTIQGLAVYDAQTGGNLMFTAYLTTAKSVSAGDGAPKILAGQLKVQRAVC
jgi:hypothetical protein